MVKATGAGYLMYFDSLAALWDMDGHGIYVWLAYLLTICPIIVMVWLPTRRLRQHWRWIEAESRRSGIDARGAAGESAR